MVKLGVDRVLECPGEFDPLYAAARVGLVSSHRCRTGSWSGRISAVGPSEEGGGSRSVPEALLAAGVSVARLFSPEHGPSGSSPDGSSISDGTDMGTGLPVVSLYGPRLRPEASNLVDLDLVVYDLPDVGARFFTYLWTLSHVLEACADARVPLWVLDRPNPIGGDPCSVEGPIQESADGSEFLGRWPIPIRHSLSMGELALLLREEKGLDVELKVIPSQGWSRHRHWPDTGLPFHPPSPGIPAYESALLYPGLALLEATNVREGRGSHLSFQWMGAPWMDPEATAQALNAPPIPGIHAHEHHLPRSRPRYPGEDPVCPGVRFEVVGPSEVRPVALGLRLLATVRTLWPADFGWAPYPTAANPSGSGHLLRLLGRPDIVEALRSEGGKLAEDRLRGWTGAEGWWRRAEPHLLYD